MSLPVVSFFTLLLQIFHCLEHNGEGGFTSLVDGFYVAERLRAEDKEAFNRLETTPVRHEYKERNKNICSLAPIIQTDPTTNLLRQVR